VRAIRLPPCSPAAAAHRLRRGLRRGLSQAARTPPSNTAGTEKRRSTEQRNTVTIGVAATQDSIFERRELGAQVTAPMIHLETFRNVIILPALVNLVYS
jgi:hypothetical protein